MDDLRAKVAEAGLGGGEVARDRHLARGKLLGRQRVAGLIDPGTPFLEFSQLAAYGLYGGDVASAGIVTTVRKTRGDDIAAACGQLVGDVQDRTDVAGRRAKTIQIHA